MGQGWGTDEVEGLQREVRTEIHTRVERAVRMFMTERVLCGLFGLFYKLPSSR